MNFDWDAAKNATNVRKHGVNDLCMSIQTSDSITAGTVVLTSTVLEWFKAQPGDYQANINHVLQDYIITRTQGEGGDVQGR